MTLLGKRAFLLDILMFSPVILVVVDSKCPLDWVQIETNCIQFNKNQHTWTDSAVSILHSKPSITVIHIS